MDPERQRSLDERLYKLYAQLQAHIHTMDRGEFEGLSEECRTIIEDYKHESGHRIWQFGTKLVDADWERQWRSGEGVYYGLFGDIERNRSAKYLHAVFTDLVRCVADKDAEVLRREYAQKLGEALKRYLVTCRPDFDVASDPAPVRYGPDRDQNGIFYWKFKPLKVAPTTWRFLLAVWGKQNFPFSDVGEAVWGDATKDGSTIRGRVKKASDELHAYGIDLPFSCEGERVSPLTGWPK